MSRTWLTLMWYTIDHAPPHGIVIRIKSGDLSRVSSLFFFLHHSPSVKIKSAITRKLNLIPREIYLLWDPDTALRLCRDQLPLGELYCLSSWTCIEQSRPSVTHFRQTSMCIVEIRKFRDCRHEVAHADRNYALGGEYCYRATERGTNHCKFSDCEIYGNSLVLANA